MAGKSMKEEDPLSSFPLLQQQVHMNHQLPVTIYLNPPASTVQFSILALSLKLKDYTE